MKPALTFWSGLLLLFVGVMTIMYASGYLQQRDAPPQADASHRDDAVESISPAGPPIEDFRLEDQMGQSFDSESLAGKIWVGSVFFSTCPSTCRVQNMRVAELQQLYGDQGVEFVSITCDPERDTVAKLNEYSKMFGAKPDRWHFLTGEFDLIKRIGNDKFGIVVEKETHSDRLVLFDRDGKLVNSYRSTVPEQFAELKVELDRLLAASGSAEEATDSEAAAAATSIDS